MSPFKYGEELMRSQKYTDLTLSCQGQEFKVHRAIVCPQSPVLAAVCDGGFKETTSRIIDLNEFDVDTVKQMIMFMYTYTYYDNDNDNVQAGPDDMPVPEADSKREVEPQIQHLGLQPNIHQTASQITPETKEKTEEGTGEVMRSTMLKSLLFHVKMNSIADYYDILELRSFSRKKVKKILNTSWSPHDFPIVMREVFNSTRDKELHDILSEVMAAHIDELMGLGRDIAPPEVLSDFANSVLRKLAAAQKQRVKDLESQLK